MVIGRQGGHLCVGKVIQRRRRRHVWLFLGSRNGCPLEPTFGCSSTQAFLLQPRAAEWLAARADTWLLERADILFATPKHKMLVCSSGQRACGHSSEQTFCQWLFLRSTSPLERAYARFEHTLYLAWVMFGAWKDGLSRKKGLFRVLSSWFGVGRIVWGSNGENLNPETY